MSASVIAEQLREVQARIPEGVTLVAVSKTHPAEMALEAYQAGQRIFGENRPQEMKQKYDVLPKDIQWHLIGHLQTNKVKLIAPFVSMIESVDSSRITEEIQKEAAKCSRTIDILLEIHVAQEETKTGWDFTELLAYIKTGAFSNLPNIRVRGVMGLATNTEDQAIVRRDFETLRQHKEALTEFFLENFDVLSMGMSGDFPLAIECGSNMVRVGSLIFGARNYGTH